EWTGLLFTSCDPVASFEEFIGDAADRFTDVDPGQLQLAEAKEYEVAAHWALYCENYLEGFHIPYVHKGLNEIVDYGTYKTEIFRYQSPKPGFDGDGQCVEKYLLVSPNMMFIFYPGAFAINIGEPMTPSRTRIKYLTYVSDESKRGTGAGGDLHRV